MREMMATLDGFDGVLDPSEGQNYSGGASWTWGLPLLPSSEGLAGAYGLADAIHRRVLDASEGANYSGGASWAPGLPLLPSSEGLASYLDAMTPSELDQVRRNVLDPSEGANYSGGSSWAPGLPLLPSSSGLAETRQQWRMGFVKVAEGRRALEALIRVHTGIQRAWLAARGFCVAGLDLPAKIPSPAATASLAQQIRNHQVEIARAVSLCKALLRACGNTLPPAQKKALEVSVAVGSRAV